MKILKNSIGIIALLVVGLYYFKYHTSYQESLVFWKEVLILMLAWGAIFAILWIGKHFLFPAKSFLKSYHFIILSFFFIWLSGIIVYASLDVAVFDEDIYIIRSDSGTWGKLQPGTEILDGWELVLKKGARIGNAEKTLSAFPQAVQKYFRFIPTIEFSKDLLITLAKVFGFWLLLIFFFYNLGALFQRKNKEHDHDFFESIGIGMAASMAVMFILGIFGILTPMIVTGVFVVLFVISSLKALSFFKIFFRYRLEITERSGKFLMIVLLLVLGIIMSFNILSSLHPVPVGHDDLQAYQNTPKLLQTYGSLISGVRAYNFELLSTLVLLIFQSTFLSLALSPLIILLSLILLFHLLQKPLGWKHGLLVITLFASLPLVSHFFYSDAKVDFALLFFGLLAIRAAISQKYVLTGIFLGVSLGIKYTALFLVGTILIGIIYSRCSWKHFKPLLVTGVWLLVALSPWLFKNIAETRSVNVEALLYGKKPMVVSETRAIKPEKNPKCEVPFSFDVWEKSTFVNYDQGWSRFLTPLLLTTANPARPNDTITDISFLFLGFFPFVVLGWHERLKIEKDSFLCPLTFFTFLYGLFWLISSYGIIWYGLFLLPALLIIYDRVWKTEKWPLGVIGLWLISAVFFQYFTTVFDNNTLMFAGGIIDKPTYIELRHEGFQRMAEYINADHEKKVYVIGPMIKYFIEKNDMRVYEDRDLNKWDCYFYDDDPEVILQRLREENFGYLVYDEKILTAEKDEQGPLHKRFALLKVFASQHLEKVIKTSEEILYIIPNDTAEST